MGYEGQIAGLMDNVPGQRIKSAIVRYLNRQSIRQSTLAGKPWSRHLWRSGIRCA
ncbi:MAG: L-gulono-1,4-lactone oxidase (EC [uncultured Caballeronia sp.]|nr:MAG: L-gulono-1,4-lactone oxidase (EC [uncultured Caballeronia sp.]